MPIALITLALMIPVLIIEIILLFQRSDPFIESLQLLSYFTSYFVVFQGVVLR